MNKILMSIKPQWCSKIFDGEKTIEVRQTRPKLEPPFEVLVYETKGQFIKSVKGACTTYGYGRGKVIGSFVCDKVYKIVPDGEYYSNGYDIDDDMLSETCLGRGYLTGYGLGYTLYGWHITAPTLFDKPRELSEFGKVCNRYENDECDDCPYLQVYVNSYPCDDCVDTWCGVDNIKPLTRPPQSFCYVEDINEI